MAPRFEHIHGGDLLVPMPRQPWLAQRPAIARSGRTAPPLAGATMPAPAVNAVATGTALGGLALPGRTGTNVEAGADAGHPRLEALHSGCACLPRIEPCETLNDRAQRMAAADPALGSGGSTTRERMARGLLELKGSIATDQEPPGQESARASALVHPCLAEAVTLARVAPASMHPPLVRAPGPTSGKGEWSRGRHRLTAPFTAARI